MKEKIDVFYKKWFPLYLILVFPTLTIQIYNHFFPSILGFLKIMIALLTMWIGYFLDDNVRRGYGRQRVLNMLVILSSPIALLTNILEYGATVKSTGSIIPAVLIIAMSMFAFVIHLGALKYYKRHKKEYMEIAKQKMKQPQPARMIINSLFVFFLTYGFTAFATLTFAEFFELKMSLFSICLNIFMFIPAIVGYFIRRRDKIGYIMAFIANGFMLLCEGALAFILAVVLTLQHGNIPMDHILVKVAGVVLFLRLCMILYYIIKRKRFFKTVEPKIKNKKKESTDDIEAQKIDTPESELIDKIDEMLKMSNETIDEIETDTKQEEKSD